jgi:hypothetical protein
VEGNESKIRESWYANILSDLDQGVKRTKLGLREFVRLGDFIQTIDTENSLAVSWGLFVSWKVQVVHGLNTDSRRCPFHHKGEQGRVLSHGPGLDQRQPDHHGVISKVCSDRSGERLVCQLDLPHRVLVACSEEPVFESLQINK